MPFDLSLNGLQRFVSAQAPVYESVVNELHAAKKTTHWMWFIFPQLKELGRSQIAKHFGLESSHEALAYWQHPVLGRRLLECTHAVLGHGNTTAHDIFGSPDELKFRSCMTLFAQLVPDEPAFRQALQRFFDGRPDDETLKLL